MRARIRSLFLMLIGTAAFGETAVLECLANYSRGTAARDEAVLKLDAPATFEFNGAPVSSWRVEKATLLLHLASGKRPASVKAVGKRLKVEEEPDGWMRVELDGRVASSALRSGLSIRAAGAAVHSRESVTFAPYLIVHGGPR